MLRLVVGAEELSLRLLLGAGSAADHVAPSSCWPSASKCCSSPCVIDIRGAEKKLHLDERDPVEAIRVLVEFTWNYYLEHPEFLTLVNSENLHKARHLKKSKIIQEMHHSYVAMISGILRAGVEKGEFRPGIDPVQLNITIAAVSYFYFNNRFTGSIIYDRDYMDPEALKTRLAFNIDTILRLLKADAP